MAAGITRATEPDPYDSVLIVYYLADEQVAEFNGSDGAVSEFWTRDWVGRDSVDVTIDYSHLVQHGSGWTGPQDAHLAVKAGGNDEGLFLCLEIIDDEWVDPEGWFPSGDDALGVWLDTLSSMELSDSSHWISAGVYAGMAISATGVFYQTWMGACCVHDSVLIGMHASTDTGALAWNSRFTLVSSLPGYPQSVALDVAWIDSTHKSQEWFIPWSAFASGAALQLSSGRRLGFDVVYADGDTSDAGGTLWWHQGTVGLIAATPSRTFWKDLELAPPSPGKSWALSALPSGFCGGRHNSRRTPGRPRYYTLKGESIQPERLAGASGSGVIIAYVVQDGLPVALPHCLIGERSLLMFE
jgi:hypothetical protein